MSNSSGGQQTGIRLLNAKSVAGSHRDSGSVGHAKMAVLRVLEAAAGRYQGSTSVLEGFMAGETQSKQAGSAPPDMQPATPAESLQPLDAVKVALAVRRRDEFCHGPSRLAWLRRRPEISKIAMVPAPAPANPGAVTANPTPPFTQPAPQPPATAPAVLAGGDPAAAYARLMAMIQPRPSVPMAGQGGTGLPTSTPGGEMGGRNTPTTNPIGLLSGLGVDPGGESVMGNAAFGTQNSAPKLAGQLSKASEYGAAMASGTSPRPRPQLQPQPQPQQPAASTATGRSRAAINRQLAGTPKPAPRRSFTQPVTAGVGVPA